MAKKPANLIYAVDETPPPWVTVVLGFQHVFVIAVGWIFIVVIVTSIGGTPEEAASVIRMSMIASGVATILQARPKSVVGSGYLCPFSCGPSYLAASLLAGKQGGMPLVFGMTAATGVFEAFLSRAMPRLRALFPTEVTGLVVSLVGMELISLACPRVLGFRNPQTPLDVRYFATALVTLAAMIGPTVWAKGKLRLYPVLLGLAAGYLCAALLGVLTPAQIREAVSVPFVALPARVDPGWSFALSLVPAFLIATLSSTLRTVGDLTLCQKINDADWKRTD